eukprot:14410447-Heterocapsa_arctica.AAC.1
MRTEFMSLTAPRTPVWLSAYLISALAHRASVSVVIPLRMSHELGEIVDPELVSRVLGLVVATSLAVKTTLPAFGAAAPHVAASNFRTHGSHASVRMARWVVSERRLYFLTEII